MSSRGSIPGRCLVCQAAVAHHENFPEFVSASQTGLLSILFECLCGDKDKVIYELAESTNYFCPKCAQRIENWRALSTEISSLLKQANRIKSTLTWLLLFAPLEKDVTEVIIKKENDLIEEINLEESSCLEVSRQLDEIKAALRREYDVRVVLERISEGFSVPSQKSSFFPASQETRRATGKREMETSDFENGTFPPPLTKRSKHSVVQEEQDDDDDAVAVDCDDDITSVKEDDDDWTGDFDEELELSDNPLAPFESSADQVTTKARAKSQDHNLFIPVGPNEFLYANKFRVTLRDNHYYCPVCIAKRKKKNKIAEHIRDVHINSKKPPPKRDILRFYSTGPNEYLFGDKFRVTFSDGRYNCSLCPAKRTRQSHLLNHIRNTHIRGKKRERKANCQEVRPNEFIYLDKFEFRYAVNDGHYVCGLCDRETNFVIGMYKHIQQDHMPKDEIQNVRAVEVAPNEFLYAGKYPIRLRDNMYFCGLCDYMRNRKSDMFPHIRKYHFPTSEGSVFGDAGAFETAGARGEDSVGTPTKRQNRSGWKDLGNGKFSRGEFHVQQRDEQFECLTCGKMSTTQKLAFLHVFNFHERPVCRPPANPLKSQVAEIGPDQFEYLKVQFSYDTERRRFLCSQCPSSRSEKGSIMLHIRQEHSGASQLFMCEICGANLKSSRNLEDHRARHRDKFDCPECKKSFTAKQYLKEHLKVHQGEAAKTKECAHCGKKFLTKKQLDNHVPTHTGEKPFECKLCGERFSSSISRRNHSKMAHGGTSNGMETEVPPVTAETVSISQTEEVDADG